MYSIEEMSLNTSTYPVIAVLVPSMGVGGIAPWVVTFIRDSAIVYSIFRWIVVIWKPITLVEPMLVGRVFSPQLTGSTTISDGYSTRIKHPVWIGAIYAWNHKNGSVHDKMELATYMFTLFIPVDLPRLDCKINMRQSILSFKGSHLKNQLWCIYVPKGCHYLNKQCRPWRMSPYAAFCLGLHCLPKYLLTGIQNEKGVGIYCSNKWHLTSKGLLQGMGN